MTLCFTVYGTQFHLKPESVISTLFIKMHPIPSPPRRTVSSQSQKIKPVQRHYFKYL